MSRSKTDNELECPLTKYGSLDLYFEITVSDISCLVSMKLLYCGVKLYSPNFPAEKQRFIREGICS